MALICRSVYSVLVVLLVANVTAAEEGLFVQLQNLDRASPGQGWQSLQAAYEPPPPDPQREALVKRYETELAWEQKKKILIMTTTVLGCACVGSMVLRHVTVAVISCAATAGMYGFWKDNQYDIEYLEDRLSKLKR